MAWTAKEHDAIVKTLAVVCEVTGTEYSDPARALIVRQLGAHSPKAVLGALERCASECKGRLTLADVISRLDDGRPGAEEAWAMFPKAEADSGCVTREMSSAWGSACGLYDGGDKIAARMAFRESYDREVRQAKSRGEDVRWMLSAGHDKSGRVVAAIEGLRRGVLSQGSALQHVEPEQHSQVLRAAGATSPKALPSHDQAQRLGALVARAMGAK